MLIDKEFNELIKKVTNGDKTPSVKVDSNLNLEIESKNGIAWVNGGKIFIRDPNAMGSWATLIPVPELDLFVNGLLQNDKVQVSSLDHIIVKTKEKEIIGNCRLVLSNDNMEASLIVEPTRTQIHELVDQEPHQDLHLKTNSMERLTCPFDLKQLDVMLAEANVVSGIDLGKAKQLMLNPMKTRITVAQGLPPGPAIDEKVEILFPKDLENSPNSKESATIDYHHVNRIFTVEEGSMLAYKHSGKAGKPGLNVRGEEIPPFLPRKAVLRADKGAVLSEDGNKVFAIKSGRPILSKGGQAYYFQVEDVLIHKGDVDIKTGNIIFKGSLAIVKGNVKESMSVHTTGLMIIEGIVNGAKVISYENLRIEGNTFDSTITAGLDEQHLINLVTLINSLQNNFQQIIRIINMVTPLEKVQKIKASYGYLFKVVMEQKAKQMPEILDKINKLCESSFVYLPEDIEQTIYKVNKVLLNPHLITGEVGMLQLLKRIILAKNYFEERKMRKANIQMAGSVNSNIFATGDITILDKGCFNTTIKAGGNVKIYGVFRRGKIKAEGSVLVDEAGTEMGANTIIEAGERSIIRINKCNEEVTIIIGGKATRILEKTKSLVAVLGKDGNIQLDSFKLKHS